MTERYELHHVQWLADSCLARFLENAMIEDSIHFLSAEEMSACGIARHRRRGVIGFATAQWVIDWHNRPGSGDPSVLHPAPVCAVCLRAAKLEAFKQECAPA